VRSGGQTMTPPLTFGTAINMCSIKEELVHKFQNDDTDIENNKYA